MTKKRRRSSPAKRIKSIAVTLMNELEFLPRDLAIIILTFISPLAYLEESIRLDHLHFPSGVCVDECDGRVFVSDRNRDRIVVYDGWFSDTLTRTRVFHGVIEPSFILYHRDRLFISERRVERVVELDAQTGIRIGYISAAKKPRGLAFLDHELFIGDTGSGQVVAVNGSNVSSTFQSVETKSVAGIAIHKNVLYVVNEKSGCIVCFDLATKNTKVIRHPMLAQIWGIAIDPVREIVYVNGWTQVLAFFIDESSCKPQIVLERSINNMCIADRFLFATNRGDDTCDVFDISR